MRRDQRANLQGPQSPRQGAQRGGGGNRQQRHSPVKGGHALRLEAQVERRRRGRELLQLKEQAGRRDQRHQRQVQPCPRRGSRGDTATSISTNESTARASAVGSCTPLETCSDIPRLIAAAAPSGASQRRHSTSSATSTRGDPRLSTAAFSHSLPRLGKANGQADVFARRDRRSAGIERFAANAVVDVKLRSSGALTLAIAAGRSPRRRQPRPARQPGHESHPGSGGGSARRRQTARHPGRHAGTGVCDRVRHSITIGKPDTACISGERS